MDITINVEDYKLNVRAAGVIIHNGKILAHKNINSDHYALIGGRVEIGESSANTIKREIKEELGKDVEITGYISTIENFFEMKGSKYHEIMFVHKIEFANEEDKKIEYTMKNIEGNMSLKESNEITLKIKCELNEFYKIIEEKGFKIIDEFSMDDTYFVPKEVDLDKTDIRDTLSKALLVRDIIGKMSNKRTKLITFKIKNFDKAGNILNQESINCNILEIEDAKKLLKVIGYKEIMNIKENDVVYEKDGFQLAVKNIKDGDNLIEIETEENDEIDTIEKLIQKVNEKSGNRIGKDFKEKN